MEACLAGARFVGCSLRGMDFAPWNTPAIGVKPFSKGQRNDCSDAQAALRSNLQSVPEKS